MGETTISSFAVRLRDLLSTLESASVLGSQEARVRGLGEQLMFACAALPCDEALVALELEHLGRLTVPGIASESGWRSTDVDFLPSGTPFAYLLGGGTGYAAQIEEGDAVLDALGGALQSEPRHAIFVPLRIGGTVLGGAALWRAAPSFGDRELTMAERLAAVLSLTIESYRGERVLLQLFATMLPDLCAPDAPTRFVEGLERYVHRLRLSPTYRERLLLADAVARLAAHGPEEARLASDVVARVEAYVRALVRGEEGDRIGSDEDRAPRADLGDLYDDA